MPAAQQVKITKGSLTLYLLYLDKGEEACPEGCHKNTRTFPAAAEIFLFSKD
jgi:hypothetical protein